MLASPSFILAHGHQPQPPNSLVNLNLGLLREGIRGDDAALVEVLPYLLHGNVHGETFTEPNSRRVPEKKTEIIQEGSAGIHF